MYGVAAIFVDTSRPKTFSIFRKIDRLVIAHSPCYHIFMKTILVDAINSLVLEDGSLLEPMHKLLESYPNKKLVLTGANDEQFKHFKLDQVPYEVFTLKHDPEKTDPQYFKILLEKYGLTADDVVYFEHNAEAAKAAQSVGINTYFYDHTKEDMDALKQFLDGSL